MDYPDVSPDPPRVTTIGWRLHHITRGNWIYWEHAFGSGKRTLLNLEIADSAAVVADLIASQQRVAEALASVGNHRLGRMRPTHMCGPRGGA
jgi:hypothetical protein